MDVEENLAIILLSAILETGRSIRIEHSDFGTITVDAGAAKKKSFGLKHIIVERWAEGKSFDQIAALLLLLVETLKNGTKTRDILFAKNLHHKGRMELEKNGIIAIISKQRNQGDSEQWLLTGFDNSEKGEAADAIQTVIAQYGYTPEFSGFRNQVGAVIASLSPPAGFPDGSADNAG